ncbi:hypothetical protein E3J49_08085 [Candidatus Bathyarchaeota archaeon]|nr:MAG: hypothetical protein E3J49_08085 [Candidatus Bathyarchaeota archaeon]
MKLKTISAAILFATILLMMSVPLPSVKADKGPRYDDWIVRYYSDVEAAYAALKAGDVHMVGYEISSDLYADAIADPNIGLGPVGDRGMYEFDLNSNYTIQDYPGIESPLFGEKRADFRRALALMSPKDRFISQCAGGFADRIDQPIAYMHKGWRNTSYWYEDGTFPYEYDPDAAAALLDAAGFVQGTTTNPDYDSGLSWSAEYIRTYPSDHPQKPGQDMDPIQICIRNNDLRRFCAGNILLDIMLKIGMPCDVTYGALNEMYDKVMVNMNYHIYTGGWSLGRFPALSVHDLYHDDYWYPKGPNYVTGKNESNLGNYPELDAMLELAYYPPDFATAQAELKKALGFHADMQITIPLWSARSFWAWNSDIKGVVNGEGVGPENGYTFMNAYKVSGGPLVYGTIGAPVAMNIISSSWYYDYQNLDRFNMASGIDAPPYVSAADQNGFITGWTTSTWVDPDDTETKAHITQNYRSDGYFTKPVTGNQGENVNTTHIYASVWYYYQVVDAWINPGVQDIKTLRIPDAGTIDYYWDVPGYWSTYQGGVYLLSFDWFTAGGISVETTETLTADGTTGYLGTTDKVFWVKSADASGTPLTLGVDYDIYMSDLSANAADIRIINPTYLGQAITVTYLAVGDPYGYTPNNQPWNTILEGCGMFYVTEFIPGVGHGMTLKRSSHFYMEKPLLGEIDFVKKPSGGYKIDIFDVVIAASAYGSEGGAVPDVNWFPGADLAPGIPKVDIFDIVTVTGKYGQEFDIPPP